MKLSEDYLEGLWDIILDSTLVTYNIDSNKHRLLLKSSEKTMVLERILHTCIVGARFLVNF